MNAVDFLMNNWAVVSAAPWTFVTAVALSLGVGFAAGQFLRSEQIANLRSRLERRDEELQRLKGTAPDPDTSGGQRHYLIGRFIAEYQHSHDNLSERVKLGLDPIPLAWINGRLVEVGETWRVRHGKDGDYEPYDV